MQIGEFFALLWLRVKFAFTNTLDYFDEVLRYYPKSISFCRTDLALLSSYLFTNPYKICRRFFESIAASEIYLYGETPLRTVELIATKCGWKASDCIYELGSGRGRCCFWLSSFVGCRVVGIEIVIQFVSKAQEIVDKYHLVGIEFRTVDIAKADYSQATGVYFYGTNFDEETIKGVARALRKLPAGSKIATVSYPLSDYSEDDLFELLGEFPARYPWGVATVYLQKVKG